MDTAVLRARGVERAGRFTDCKVGKQDFTAVFDGVTPNKTGPVKKKKKSGHQLHQHFTVILMAMSCKPLKITARRINFFRFFVFFFIAGTCTQL